jgi:hypothetical protein
VSAVRGLLDLTLNQPCFDRRQRAARRRSIGRTRALALDAFVSSSIAYAPPTGSTVLATAVLAAMICCVRKRDARRFFRRQRQRLVAPLQCSDCVPPSTAASACSATADDVVVGLLRGQRAAARLRVEAQLLRARLVASNRSRMMRAHSRRAARNFAISSRKSLCALKKNDSRWPNWLTSSRRRSPPARRRSHAQRERDFLHRRRSGFPDVVAADRDRVPVRQLALAEREDVGDDAERLRAADRCRCRARRTPSGCRSGSCPTARAATPCARATAM